MSTANENSLRGWFKSGEPWVWMNAAAVTVGVLMVLGLLGLIMVRGLGHFWPATLYEADYTQQSGEVVRVAGEMADEEVVSAQRLRDAGYTVPDDATVVTRLLIKQGNRELNGLDFLWVEEHKLDNITEPQDMIAIERREWGNFYGYLEAVKEHGEVVAEGEDAWQAFHERVERALTIHDEITEIEKGEIGSINYKLEQLRLQERGMEINDIDDPALTAEIASERGRLQEEYDELMKQLNALYKELGRDSVVMRTADGKTKEISLSQVVQIFKPNDMGLFAKIGHYFGEIWGFLSNDPREANTEGGVFPAIFGTIMMVIVMSILVTPLGVVAAVYLREYAKQGALVRLIRISINNLAGVPSIVYGVFGLGFFVYFLGGSIDELFFEEALPSPTFGTPGLLWASITLALLTLPVVIVSTEEGLARVPRAIREGSLALGATKAETLWRTVLPMASPAMMTGLILAVARAAGEVAPLMLVGVVKLAPSLPLDGNAPFLHLDRKFMHLGFHIYDVGFQSPNVEAARPLVFATAFLLVLVILVLNLISISIRNRLREKYKSLEH